MSGTPWQFLSPVNTVKSETAVHRFMRSANLKMATKWNVPLTLSLCPVRGWHCNPSPSLAVYELVCCEQWNSGAVIPLVLVRWIGQRVNGGRGDRHRPGACWQRPRSHTLWTSNCPTQMDSDEERGGWLSDPDVWAGHNGTVCFANPALSVISKFYTPLPCTAS